jgi:hypothetical protein
MSSHPLTVAKSTPRSSESPIQVRRRVVGGGSQDLGLEAGVSGRSFRLCGTEAGQRALTLRLPQLEPGGEDPPGSAANLIQSSRAGSAVGGARIGAASVQEPKADMRQCRRSALYQANRPRLTGQGLAGWAQLRRISGKDVLPHNVAAGGACLIVGEVEDERAHGRPDFERW